jgi:hypothetical protein
LEEEFDRSLSRSREHVLPSRRSQSKGDQYAASQILKLSVE